MAPLATILVATVWCTVIELARGGVLPPFDILFVISVVGGLLSAPLGVLVGAHASQTKSALQAVATGVVIAYPASIVLIGMSTGFTLSGEDLVSVALSITFIGTFTSVAVTLILRARNAAKGKRHLQLSLHELLFLCVLLAICLVWLG